MDFLNLFGKAFLFVLPYPFVGSAANTYSQIFEFKRENASLHWQKLNVVSIYRIVFRRGVVPFHVWIINGASSSCRYEPRRRTGVDAKQHAPRRV